jgi:hypothetical protein
MREGVDGRGGGEGDISKTTPGKLRVNKRVEAVEAVEIGV